MSPQEWASGGITTAVVSVLILIVQSYLKQVTSMAKDQGDIVKTYIETAKQQGALFRASTDNLAQLNKSMETMHTDHIQFSGDQNRVIAALAVETCHVTACPLRGIISAEADRLRLLAAEELSKRTGTTHAPRSRRVVNGGK